MENNLTPELKAAFEAIIKAEPGSPDSAVGFLLNCMLKAYNYRPPIPATLTLQFEQIINNMPQEGEFTLPWLCELMGKARDMDRWVDVKVKRCPTMTGLLVWTGKEVGYRIFSKTHEEFSTDAFITRTGVTHWQPLPNPPTEAVRKDGEG